METCGFLVLDGYGGRSYTRVAVIGTAPKRWRIRALTATRLAGRARVLQPGGVALVPRSAVVFSHEHAIYRAAWHER